MDDAQPDRQESTQGRVQEPHRLDSVVSVWQRPTQAVGPHAFQHDPQASLSAPTISLNTHTHTHHPGPRGNSIWTSHQFSTFSAIDLHHLLFLFLLLSDRLGKHAPNKTYCSISTSPSVSRLLGSTNFILSNLSLGQTALPSSDTRPSLSFLRIRQMASPPPEL